ncbi:MAG: hypothetical protein IPP82_07900 [Xanthomonadales bacterium]|nr:hypothetical protein [Xanthomonadales bacterium]
MVWLVLASVLVLGYQDKLYSTSIDLAMHGTLISELMSSWSLPDANVNLAEMAVYPRVAHQLASIASKPSGSAIMGMQEIAILSLFLLWTIVGISFSGLTYKRFIAALATLTAIALGGHLGFGIEYFGNELIGSYFYAQLVAQSLGMAILGVAMRREWSTPNSNVPIALLSICIPLLASIHLLAALELLGTLAILALLRALTPAPTGLISRILSNAGLFIGSTVLLVANPDFLAMVRISANNGGISLRHVTSILEVVGLATLTALVCSFMIFQWWRKRDGSHSYLDLLFKYFGAFGLSTASLCLTQVFLLKFFALGSLYACLKYVVAMQSLLAIATALFVALCVREAAARRVTAYSKLIGILFAAAMCMCIFSGPIAARTEALVAAEIDARQFASTRIDRAPAKYDLAIGIKDVPAVGNYFLSHGILGSPSFGISMDVLYSRMPSPPGKVGQILTSQGSYPWDVVGCRRGSAGALMVLEGGCVYGSFRELECKGVIDFASQGTLDMATSGFSNPGADGRWSEGSAATLTCKLGHPAPTVAYLDTAGLVSSTHSQRMSVSINGEGSQTIDYSEQAPSRTIKIPLPGGNTPELIFRFEFPDAISPHELGMNTDERKLAVMMYKLRFE